MFTGDMVKTELEGLVRQMRAPLRRRLRFITHMSDEGPSVAAAAAAGTEAGQKTSNVGGGESGGAVGLAHPAPSPAGPQRPLSNAAPGMPPSPFVSGT